MCKDEHLDKGQRRRLWANPDPISKLNLEMLYRQVQFLVKEADWAGHGEGVVLEG
jgi:hypothetical protein